MEVHLNETESRYFGDLFLCCDVEKVGKISILKAMELYRSANLQNDKILEVFEMAKNSLFLSFLLLKDINCLFF